MVPLIAFFLWCDIFSVGFRDFVVCIRGSLFVLWHGVKGGRGGGVDACFFYALA